MDYPFRVQSPTTSARFVEAIAAQGVLAPAPPQAGDDPGQQYLSRVLKLIPAEVITLYQGAYGVVTTASGQDADAKAFLNWLPWIGLVIVIFVRGWGTRDASGSLRTIQAGAVAIAAVSFAIWVISMGHPIAGVGVVRTWIGNLLLMIWPFVIPFFYKGD